MRGIVGVFLFLDFYATLEKLIPKFRWNKSMKKYIEQMSTSPS